MSKGLGVPEGRGSPTYLASTEQTADCLSTSVGAAAEPSVQLLRLAPTRCCH